MDLKNIEFWEHEYLEQIYYLLTIDKDKMLNGLSTKEDIRHDWEEFLGRQTSKSAVGSERIFYWLFNQFGIPNSSPIGSDLFFETYNAYIHIDVKTDKKTNSRDFNGEVTIQNNQTSYSGWVCKQNGNHCKYTANLPTFYNKPDGSKKVCLTYFISILYDEREYKVQSIVLTCMPNGELYDVYGNNVFKAGKTVGNPPKCTARYKWRDNKYFELLDDKPLRTKVLVWDPDDDINPNDLKHVKAIYDEQREREEKDE